MEHIQVDIARYTPELCDAWNTFVRHSKNGTFLFDRRYMDYHADRFTDCSLMFYIKGQLQAVLPAVVMKEERGEGREERGYRSQSSQQEAQSGNTAFSSLLSSHAGLTYGGLVMSSSFSAADAVELFRQLNIWLKAEGIRRVVYKPVPHIYHRLPAEEDLYALHHICGARLIGRDLGTDIVRSSAPRWERVRRRGVGRAADAGITVRRSDDWAAFWQILSDNLDDKYGVKPVHTLDEITLLKERFPDEIALFGAYRGEEMLGGLVVYVTPQVVHAQYSSATEEGKALGAMDAIYHHVLDKEYLDRPHFDFGRSTEGADGAVLNTRLTFQKEGYGGRSVCYDTYAYEIP